MNKSFRGFLFLCASAVFADEKIQLGSLFQDGAVFQQNRDIPVWGKAEPGHLLRGEFAGQTICTRSNTSGEFLFRFAPVKAGGPYALVVTDVKNKNSVTVNDILVGEVWLASGQSNMEYQLGSDWVGKEKLKNDPHNLARRQQREFCSGLKEYPEIRYFTVPRSCTGIRETSVSGQWKKADAGNASGLSAVSAWFGRTLQQKMKIPVGFIVSAVGGTPVETWTSRTGLLSNPETVPLVRETDQIMRDPLTWEIAETPGKAWRKDPGNTGYGSGYASPEFDDSQWKKMKIPGSWIAQKISGNGIIWARREVTIPEEWSGKELILETGGIDKQDITYFNGVEIGRTGKDVEVDHYDKKRRYIIPGELVKAGKNVIAIRAFSFVYDGGFNGAPDDYKLVSGSEKKHLILSGIWKAFPEVNFGILNLRSAGYGPGNTHTPGFLYDSMIHPLIPYAVRGVIWYQGEENASTLSSARSYQKRLESMINDWRYRWGQGDFPFLQVQLANYNAAREGDFRSDSPWAYLRDAQRLICEKKQNVFMVSAIDCGEPDDIHPQDKKTVGMRLAFSALHHVYSFEEIIPAGPLYKDCSIEGNKVRLRFRYAEGLHLKGDYRKSFYIGTRQGVFYPADSLEIDGNCVILSSEMVDYPAVVRYAWSQAGKSVLYNEANLPASPFRTDCRN